MNTRPRGIPKYVQRRVKHSLLYVVLFALFMMFSVAIYRGGVHISELEAESITLSELPFALAMSLMRMTVAYLASLVFSFTLGLLAARTKWGERIIIPALDVLQSVPVVGFFPAAITFFISVTNGHRFGVELAAIFLIFTSQAWNLAFAIYEALKGAPQDSVDAVRCFGIRGSKRFWKLYAPTCVPRLVYNSILSWSNGWFFLVACEIIAVGPVKYHIPGIGSFLARAAEQDQITYIIWGLVALTSLIVAMDFFIWRPASAWAERYRHDFISESEEHPDPTFGSLPQTLFSKMNFLERPAKKMLRAFFYPFVWTLKEVIFPLIWDLPVAIGVAIWETLYAQFVLPMQEKWGVIQKKARWVSSGLGWVLFLGVLAWAGTYFYHWLKPPYPSIISDIPLAILASTGRLIVAMLISLAWIIPLILFCWNRPKFRGILMTFAQIGASLPAVALFPLFIVVAVRKLGGGMEIASLLLLLTGMQWYLLFNCLGGVATIPGDIKQATHSFGLNAKSTWKRLVLPAIRPALVTGGITAWGGGWNALVVAEYVLFKGETLKVNGIGSLLNYSVYELGDGRAITLCLVAMVGWILLLNVIFWRPIYQSAIERYKFDI